MGKRFSLLVLVTVALMLAGLGHYYLLYQRTYVWDAVVFYAVAALLTALAYRRARVVPERRWRLVRTAWRRLAIAWRGLFLRAPNRLLIGVLTAANGLAALLAFLFPSPAGLLVALLWGGGVAALVALVRRPRRARPEPAPAPDAVPAETSTVQPGRYAVPVAIGGWLLLVVGLAMLGLDDAPRVLKPLDVWLQPRLASLRADVPMPPGVWLPALLLLAAGVILIGRAGGGAVGLPGVPTFTIQAPQVAGGLRPSRGRFALVFVGSTIWLAAVGAAAAGSTHGSVIPLWLAAIAVLAVYWWQADRARGVSPFPARTDRRAWLVVLASVIVFGVTLYRLDDVPNSLWGDEGAFWWWARDLAQGVRVAPFDLGVYGAFSVMGSLYQSLWLRLFGFTLWSWRLGSVVAGTLAMVPLFFLTRRVLGSRVAWSAVALMVGMPYFLAYGRMGYNNIQSVLPVTMSLWLLVEGVQRRSHALSYLAGVVAGMGFLTYTAGYMAVVLVALFWLFLFFSRRPSHRMLLGLALCLMVGWLFGAGPFVLGNVLGDSPGELKMAESFVGNVLYGETMFSAAEMTRRYPLWQVGTQQIFFEPRSYALLIGRGAVRTVLCTITSEVLKKHYLVGPLAGPGAIFFLGGLAWALGQRRRLRAVLWVAWILVCVLVLGVLNTFPPRPAHMVPIIPALAVLVAVGIWLLSDLLRRLLSIAYARWTDWFGVVLTVCLALWGLRAYFVEMPRLYTPNLENVMFWRAQEMGRGSSVVFVFNESYPPEFSVWGIDNFDLGVAYHGVPVSEVRAADFRALCGMACRVFFLPENAEVVVTHLYAQLGHGAIQTHFDAQGRAIGQEFVPLALGTDVSAPGGWQSGTR